jgi:hypothetical protein
MLRKDFLQNIGLGSVATALGFLWPVKTQKFGFSNSDNQYTEFETPNFNLKLQKDSQTIASLKPKGANGFDFVPSGWLNKRHGNGYYYLGDITMRLRHGKYREWKKYSTALNRKKIKSLDSSKSILAAASLNPTLPADIPLNLRRYWMVKNGHLVLSYELENKIDEKVEIGALGIPMVFNNILTNRTLPEAYHKCSFYDPYIGLEAGYLQVTRLNGHGPALVIVPEENVSFEAYKLLSSDKTRRSNTFEGFHEWMVYTKAYAENEWKKAKQWNVPSSIILKPGQKKAYAVKFLLADQIRGIEDTLIQHKRPVAVGIPGYVVPMDQNAKLFLKYEHSIQSINVEPSDALSIKAGGTTKSGWKEYHIKGRKWGRSRLIITYKDGLKQSVHYKVIKPQRRVMRDVGNFLVANQWFDRKGDFFNRNPAPISYDYFEAQQVTQERRAWIAGLSNEGGNGSWVALMIKQLIAPDKKEIDKLQEFVDGELDGNLQYNKGSHKYGVRRSMFYYDPDKVPAGTYNPNIGFGGWESVNKKKARSVDRAYDYVPVAAMYWVLYRLARNYEGLVTNHSWKWYLKRACQTAIAMERLASYLAQFGLMEGTVFVKILEDLKEEGWTDWARKYKKVMKKRADRWKRLAYPFKSEMPWDSTGQEEVYAWCHYFGYDKKAKVTIDAIKGYMPAIPHWGYNGNARRYWDFKYAGKLPRLERQIHHYGSGLNAIPVLTAYRNQPDDFYLLRIGYGGLMGAISNVTRQGFGPCAFHAFPETLRIDGYSGDYGPNFLGHVINTGAYVVNHTEFGWLAFGGNLQQDGNGIEVEPLDSARSRFYLAPVGLWLTLDAGEFKRIRFDKTIHTIQLTFDGLSKHVPNARLKIEQMGVSKKNIEFKPVKEFRMVRGAYIIPLNKKQSIINLKAL